MKVIWDLRICPITFDFAVYLAIVDCYRQLNHAGDKIDMTIRADNFRNTTVRDSMTSAAEKRWRLKSIVLDMCELLPSIESLSVTQREVGPFDYPIDYKKNGIRYLAKYALELHRQGANPIVFQAPQFARDMISVPRKYATLTLRTSRHFPERNADLGQWYRFYQHLRSAGIDVLVVPDQEDVLTGKEYTNYDWETYVPASFDLRLRLALYEKAVANFGSSNGPVAMTFFSSAPIIQFDQLRGGHLDTDFWKINTGFAAGGQFPWSRPDQRMTWKDSTFENMVAEWKSLKLP